MMSRCEHVMEANKQVHFTTNCCVEPKLAAAQSNSMFANTESSKTHCHDTTYIVILPDDETPVHCKYTEIVKEHSEDAYLVVLPDDELKHEHRKQTHMQSNIRFTPDPKCGNSNLDINTSYADTDKDSPHISNAAVLDGAENNHPRIVPTQAFSVCNSKNKLDVASDEAITENNDDDDGELEDNTYLHVISDDQLTSATHNNTACEDYQSFVFKLNNNAHTRREDNYQSILSNSQNKDSSNNYNDVLPDTNDDKYIDVLSDKGNFEHNNASYLCPLSE